MADDQDASLPSSRPEAKAVTGKFYFTGFPCKRGHVAKRRTGDGRCLGCEAEPEFRAAAVRRATKQKANASLQWHKARAAVDIAKRRAWEQANPEAASAKRRAERESWTPEQRTKRSQTMKKWRIANRQYVSAYTNAYKAQWRINNIEKARLKGRIARHRRRARELNAEGYYTADDVQLLMTRQEGKCATPGCCVNIVDEFEVDHVLPLVSDGSNWPMNLQLLCPPCNSQKSAMTMDEFVKRRNGS